VKVAVIGSAGQLGTEVCRAFGAFGHDVSPLSHADVDVTDLEIVRQTLRLDPPQAVVNCAAYVRVDDAEGDAESAFQVNAIGALNVARVGAELNALCMYISTDYVFDGEKTVPYTEGDIPRPINVYGASKLAGEYLVRQGCAKSMIVRVASLFGKSGARAKGGNFIETILSKARRGEALRVVNDIQISPTYCPDVAAAIVDLAQRGTLGIIHVTNSGACTWYDLAKEVVVLCGLEVSLEAVANDAFPRRATRPRNSALDNTQITTLLGAPLPPWEDAVRRYLRCQGYIK
jgi:dTDP-4-dehydrorhamnose reductase